MRRIIFSMIVLPALVLMTTTAGAAPTKPRLSFVKGGGASISWSNEGGSSPADDTGNTQSLRIDAPAGGGASAYTYGASEDLVDIRGRALSAIDRLGFDTKGYLGAGAPRISLGTVGDDGDHTYFLAASHCNDPLGGGWVTADFIHDSTNCEIFRDNEQAPYVGWAAVAAVADANHEVVVSSPNDWFLIVDESPSLTYVDRLTVQEWMWTRSGSRGIVNCNSGDCIDG
jgi:hypothetical protein